MLPQIAVLMCTSLILTGCSPSTVEPPPPDAPPPATLIASVAPFAFHPLPALNEPSGIVYHPGRNTLFAVGDSGDVYELSLTYSVLRTSHISNSDFEGITVDPASGLLYIVVEGADSILELLPDTLIVQREFPVDRFFKGSLVLAPGGNGLEAITYVPDASLPGGGIFYVANQSRDISGAPDSSALLALQLPRNAQTAAKIRVPVIAYYPMPISDISGLQYNPARDTLFMISDNNNLLSEVSRDGTVLASCPLPGKDQEGITQTPDGMLSIAQDSGGILTCTLTLSTKHLP